MSGSVQLDRVPADGLSLEQLRVEVKQESGDGAALSADPADNPVCLVSIDGSLGAVSICWKRYATTRQLMFVQELALDLIQAHTFDAIIADDTDLQAIHIQDRQWIVDSWLPRARAGGLKFIATKRPANHFGQVAAQAVHDQAPSELTIANFDTLEAARDWLETRPRQDA